MDHSVSPTLPPDAVSPLALTRADLIEGEHFLKETLSRFFPFGSYRLYFPRPGAEPFTRYDAEAKELSLPLVHPGSGEVMAIFVAREAKLTAPGSSPTMLAEAARLALETLSLRKTAMSDTLTGLLNEQYFFHQLTDEIRQVASCLMPGDGECIDSGLTRYTGRCAVILADVDRFESLVERHGYGVAEDVLRHVGALLSRLAPVPARCARLSRDHFAILLPDGGLRAAEEMAEQMRLTLARTPMKLDAQQGGGEVEVRASFGVAAYPANLPGGALRAGHYEQARALVRRAARAMGAAKTRGRGRVVTFEGILAEGGEVLELLPLGRLRVSLGRSVDAREGMRFLVWSPSVQGAGCEAPQPGYPAMYKGEVVLVETQAEQSFADVLHRTDPSWELAVGDRLLLVREGDESLVPQGVGEAGIAGGALANRDMLTGLYGYRDFLERLAAERVAHERFCVALVRVAELGVQSDYRSAMEEAVREVVRHMERCIADAGGGDAGGVNVVGGRYSLNAVAFLLPEPVAEAESWREELTVLAERMREEYGVRIGAGVAQFPFLDTRRAEVLGNAHKALDHALMLPEPMVAVCDSLSLNVAADRRFAHGEVYDAIELYKQALLADEANHLARNSLAVCLGRVGRLEEAIRLFEQVVEAEPDNLMAVYNLGCSLMRDGNQTRAAECFARCVELSPAHVFSLIRLGQLAEHAGDAEAALDFYERAEGVPDGGQTAWRHLARVSIHSGDVTRGKELLHRAIIHNPLDDHSIHLLARLYVDSGEDAEIAASLAEKAAELRPGHAGYAELAEVARGRKSA